MAAPRLFPRILAAAVDGRVRNVRYRQGQFLLLQSAIIQNVEEIKKALREFSGHTPEEICAELCLALDEIRAHYGSLDLNKSLEDEYSISSGKDHRGGRRGTGIVYIVPIEHTIFFSIISALSAALAAGNCIILELTGSSNIKTTLRRVLVEALDRDTFAVSEERPDEVFLRHTLLINQQQPYKSDGAARTRSVAVVNKTANLAQAVEALVSLRFGFGGKSPFAPDCVVVHEAALNDFLARITEKSLKYHAANEGSGGISSGSKSAFLTDAEKAAGAKVIVSGNSWGVVRVEDRDLKLLERKPNERVLWVKSCTSLDDAIEACRQYGSPVAAYIFADPASAKYLAQFIDARFSWVNHIPLEMLIGPLVDERGTLESSTRYSRSAFEVPRAQVVTESHACIRIKSLLGTKTAKKAKIWREATAPLRETGQSPGGGVGHFEQGIISGGLVILSSVAIVVSIFGYYTMAYSSR
ncbi:Aldehyde/histidinol dehydrogenase [Aspergillus similis]